MPFICAEVSCESQLKIAPARMAAIYSQIHRASRQKPLVHLHLGAHVIAIVKEGDDHTIELQRWMTGELKK
jgi:hypothetical protein